MASTSLALFASSLEKLVGKKNDYSAGHCRLSNRSQKFKSLTYLSRNRRTKVSSRRLSAQAPEHGTVIPVVAEAAKVQKTGQPGGHVSSFVEEMRSKSTDATDSSIPTPARDGCRMVHFPVIDFAGIFNGGHSGKVARSRIRNDLRRAGSRFGTFYVVNHGINGALLDQLVEDSRGFLSKPQHEKERYEIDFNLVTDGYCRNAYFRIDDLRAEKKRDLYIESIRYHLHPREKVVGAEFWPHDPPSLRDSVLKVGDALREFTELILELIAESLRLRSSSIIDAIGGSNNVTTRQILYHPRTEEDDDTPVTLPEHTDYNIINIIVAERVSHPALQVLLDPNTPQEEWVTMQPPPPHALLIFVGDQLETYTNGAFISAGHRVLANAEFSRVSGVFSYSTEPETVVAPLPQLIDEDHPQLYREFKNKDRLVYYMTPGTPGIDKAWYRIHR